MSYSKTVTRQVQVSEYSQVGGVRLSVDDAVALNRLTTTVETDGKDVVRRVVRLEPDSENGTYAITSTSIVGSVRVGNTQVSIIPKVGVGRTAFMLGYALRSVRWRSEGVWQSTGDLVEALVLPFLDSVEDLVGTGLSESYVRIQEDGSRPRGSIDFSWNPAGMPLPVRYSYDDLSIDNSDNRVVRAALERILSVEGLSRLGGEHASRLLDPFEGVGPLRFDDVGRDSSDKRYEQVVNFARMIIGRAGIEPAAGTVASSSILFDMNAVFESFLCRVVKQKFESEGLLVDSQGLRMPRYLADRRRLRVRPDFSIWNRDRCLVVGDVKYKLLKGSLRRSDLYQSIAYALATGAKHALLLYAGTGPAVEVHIPTSGTTVRAEPIDLMSLTEREIVPAVANAVGQMLDRCVSPSSQ